MANHVITLTTDFGEGSPYVAAMKGVILAINQDAKIIDISHSIPPQDIQAGAFAWEETTKWFPEDTIHVGVVDPTVGTNRRILLATFDNQHYIAPDNGLLTGVARAAFTRRIIDVTDPAFWLDEVSATFHGRDIMAPVAAHLSLHGEPERFGDPTDEMVALDLAIPRFNPDQIVGCVVSIDSFGNLITNITTEMAKGFSRKKLVIRCKNCEIQGLTRTYGDGQMGELVALLGSSQKLELAVVGGHAAREMDCPLGESVIVEW